MFRKGLGTVLTTVTVKPGNVWGKVAIYAFGEDKGHRGGRGDNKFVIPVGYKFRREYQGGGLNKPVLVCGRTVCVDECV